MSEFKAKMHKIRFPPGLRPAPRLRTALPRPVAAIQVVQVVRCTRAHDPWGPTSEDQIAIFFKNYFLLFLTLPVTVATAERSFSKLKLIKTYLRNTMQDGRLSGLAVLSIENAEARKLDVSKIIDDFASRKARRRKF